MGDCLDWPATCEGEMQRGLGKAWQWLGGKWEHLGHAADAGRGRDKEGSGGGSCHTFVKELDRKIPACGTKLLFFKRIIQINLQKQNTEEYK